jgi:PAS domain S-box-containing protein
MLKNLVESIRVKLIGAYLFIAALALGVGLVGYVQIGRVNDILIYETMERAEARYLSTKIRVEVLQVSSLVESYVTADSEAARTRLATQFGDELLVLNEFVNQIEEHVADSEEEQAMLSEIAPLIQDYLAQARAVMNACDAESQDFAEPLGLSASTELGEVSGRGLSRAAGSKTQGALDPFRTTRARLLERLAAFEDQETSLLYASRQAARETVGRALAITIALAVAALVGGVVLGWWTSWTITWPVGRLVEATQRIAAGDLEHPAEVRSRNEIGQLATTFNQMARELKKTLREKDDVAQQLRDFNQRLEQMVAGRTAELEASNRDLEARRRELLTLQEVSQQISSLLSLESVLEQMVDSVVRAFGYEAAAFFLVDEATNEVYLAAQSGLDEHFLKRGRLKIGQEGLSGHVAASGEPLLVTDVSNDPRYMPGVDGIKSGLYVPLLMGQRVIGVFSVESKEYNAFSPHDLEIMMALANQAAVAIENARLFQQVQANQARLTSLYEASQLLAGAHTMESVMQAALVMASYIGAQHGDLILLDVRGHPVLYSTVPGRMQFTPEQAQAFVSQVIASRVERWVLEHRQSALILDTTQDPRWPALPDGEVEDPVRSAICVPLFDRHGEIMGTLSYTHPQPRVFGPEERRLAEVLADQVAIALENARLYEIAQRRAEEAETLHQAGAVVAATLRQDEAIERILRELARVVPYDSASVQLLREGYLEIVGGRGWLHPETVLGLRFTVPGDNPNSVVIQQRQPYILADAPAAYATFQEDTHSDVRSWLGVPLIVRDRVIGMLAVESMKPNYFTSNHARLVAAFTDQVAIAIEDARLYQEIQREKQYFESLVLNSPAAIVVIDFDHNVVSWNPAAEKLFGYTQAEALGRNIDDLVATEAIRAEAAAYSQQTAGGDSIHAITRRSRRDGTLVDVELFAVPVIVEGEQVGALAIYHDITEIQRARQEAEAANQAKSAFLAMMSHEIRTPMNAVIGMTSLLLDTDLTPEQQEFVETIRTSGDALLTIINDILDFSKIEAGRTELENQPFVLHDCVEGALDQLASKAAEKGLNLAYYIDDQAPASCFGDMTRLRQILVNLLSNAVKFTEQGEVVVSVDSRFIGDGEMRGEDENAETSSPPRYELHFVVRDTGIGIPPERMDRLFQSFSQVDASTTRRYGGTGLGLAISKRLSEMMGGTMWVESEVGKGSTFHFTIQAEAAPSPMRVGLQGIQPDLSGKRVLVVDDNATNRRILTLQTQSWGMLPRSTASPAEALEWIRQGDPFDVAILDMQMPEMDGLTLAAEMRRERDTEALPLVMLTSLGQQEADVEGGEFAAFLTKPIKASQLYNVLVGILAEKAQLIQRRDEAAKPQFDPEMGQRLPLRILLAEDNAVNQKLALRLLERMGYRADVAANGVEAIEALRRQPYDVVLMDVQMPEMDGLEATRAIYREWPRAQRPRIIAMTANVMKEDREACLAAGMDDYIGKPIRVQELVSVLRRCRPFEETQGSETAEHGAQESREAK